MTETKTITKGIITYLWCTKPRSSNGVSCNILKIYPYEKNTVVKNVVIIPAFIPLFKIKFKAKNSEEIIKNVSMSGVRSSSTGISLIFSEYNKIIGKILNKKGKITNLFAWIILYTKMLNLN